MSGDSAIAGSGESEAGGSLRKPRVVDTLEAWELVLPSNDMCDSSDLPGADQVYNMSRRDLRGTQVQSCLAAIGKVLISLSLGRRDM